MKSPRGQAPNLYDLRPRRLFESERGDGGRAIVLVPKFRSGPLARWLQTRLPKPHVRVKLDDLGTFVWDRCDGSHSVLAIAEEAEERFGASQPGLTDRVAVFVRTLARQDLVTLKEGT